MVSADAIAYHAGMATGICREHNGEGVEDSARVDYGRGPTMDVCETLYRSRGYQPPFDDLPWCQLGQDDQHRR